MILSTIINQLKTNAPTFQGRVAGSAEYEVLKNATNMQVPAAYVIPQGDNPGENRSKTGWRQTVADFFVVVVVLDNQIDERGQAANDYLHAIRAELWLALLGFKPSSEYDRIGYSDGGKPVIDRYRMDYQFEFYAELDIDQSMTWQGVEISNAPAFKTTNIKIDHKDLPPDGVIDHLIDVDIPQ